MVWISCGPTHVVVQSDPAPAPPPPPAPELSYQTFYDALSPYGTWIDYPGYGYVWMPNAGPDFKPYATGGNWVYTDAGWTWSSEYAWGWAPFHYGRWFFDDSYGWMWIPGREWAPAWVAWRSSPEYYGWAPLGPSYGSANADLSTYRPPVTYWNFVPSQYVSSPHITNYYVNETKNVTIVNNTTVINRTVIINNVSNTTVINNNNGGRGGYAAGPDPQEVARVTGQPVHPLALRTTNEPGSAQVSGGQLGIYRPRISANESSTARTANAPAPTHVQNLHELKPRNTNNNASTQSPASTPAGSAGNRGFQSGQHAEPIPANTAGTPPANGSAGGSGAARPTGSNPSPNHPATNAPTSLGNGGNAHPGGNPSGTTTSATGNPAGGNPSGNKPASQTPHPAVVHNPPPPNGGGSGANVQGSGNTAGGKPANPQNKTTGQPANNKPPVKKAKPAPAKDNKDKDKNT